MYVNQPGMGLKSVYYTIENKSLHEEQRTDMSSIVDECATLEKPDIRENEAHDSIFVKCPRKVNLQDRTE